MSVRAYLALGSNVGDRKQALAQAVKALQETKEIKVTKLSAIYETDPVGYTDQPAFLNMVAAIDTTLAPNELLLQILGIEQQLGRIRTVRWGPRVIDIDILLYGKEHVEQPDLQVPHPFMSERAFVLIPLKDVWEGGALPVYGKTIDEYLEEAEDAKGVRKWGTLD